MLFDFIADAYCRGDVGYKKSYYLNNYNFPLKKLNFKRVEWMCEGGMLEQIAANFRLISS